MWSLLRILVSFENLKDNFCYRSSSTTTSSSSTFVTPRYKVMGPPKTPSSNFFTPRNSNTPRGTPTSTSTGCEQMNSHVVLGKFHCVFFDILKILSYDKCKISFHNIFLCSYYWGKRPCPRRGWHCSYWYQETKAYTLSTEWQANLRQCPDQDQCLPTSWGKLICWKDKLIFYFQLFETSKLKLPTRFLFQTLLLIPINLTSFMICWRKSFLILVWPRFRDGYSGILMG